MTLEVIKTIPVGGSPSRVALTPDGGRAYVLNGGGDSVSVISTVTNTVTTTIPVGDLPDSVAISPDGTRAYVTIENADKAGQMLRTQYEEMGRAVNDAYATARAGGGLTISGQAV